MAHGKTRKDVDRRMARVGLVPTCGGLEAIRQAHLSIMPRLVAAAWPERATERPKSRKEVGALLLAEQRASSGAVNSVWAERARISATDATARQHLVRQRKLFGRVMHLDKVAKRPVRDAEGRKVRRLANFPEACSLTLTDDDVADLRRRTEGLKFAGVLALMRKVREGTSRLPKVQADALLAMLGDVEARYVRPEWDPDATVQLHLDARCVLGTYKAWPDLLKAVDAGVKAAARKGERGEATFGLTAHRARGGHVMLPMTFRPEVLAKLLSPVLGAEGETDRGQVSSLAVEIGPRSTEVKAVVAAKPWLMLDLSQVITIVGRDFGYAYTCSWSVVRVPAGALTQERVDLARSIIEMRDKEGAKAFCREYLSTHASEIAVVQQKQFEGRDFLDAVYGHCKVIDRCNETIDDTYANVRGVKKVICDGLRIPHDTRLDLDAEHPDPRIDGLVRRLGRQLASIAAHKDRRTRAYAAIDGLKRSWFGWVANREVELLKACPGAVLVREGLDNVAIPVDDPKYKGRTFNKMINAGARGRYAGCAGNKLRWNGIRELQVPSFYTSTTDHRHAVVDAEQRKGETFKASADDARWQADLHASHTIALWLVMELRRLAGDTGATEVAQAA